MKKIIFIYLLFALVLVSAVSASVLVMGVVYYPEKGMGNEVVNATVVGVCDGVTRNDITNDYGIYKLTYTGSDCGAEDTVYVTATKEGLGSGSASGILSNGDTFNIALVDVVIPEFGTITAGLALVGAAAGYLRMRKRRNISV